MNKAQDTNTMRHFDKDLLSASLTMMVLTFCPPILCWFLWVATHLQLCVQKEQWLIYLPLIFSCTYIMTMAISTVTFFSSIRLTRLHWGGEWGSQRLRRHNSQDPSFNSSKVLPGSVLRRACVCGCGHSDLKCIYSVACSSGNSQRDCQRWAMMVRIQTHTTNPQNYVWDSTGAQRSSLTLHPPEWSWILESTDYDAPRNGDKTQEGMKRGEQG